MRISVVKHLLEKPRRKYKIFSQINLFSRRLDNMVLFLRDSAQTYNNTIHKLAHTINDNDTNMGNHIKKKVL